MPGSAIRTTPEIQQVLDLAAEEFEKANPDTPDEYCNAVARALMQAMTTTYRGIHLSVSEVAETLVVASVTHGVRGVAHFPYDAVVAENERLERELDGDGESNATPVAASPA
ncbi:hypothetical protein [Promicromonospora iranensis]|uniref:Uncharacterized protein n=1 Tax=Promicromonospora iranensis TaxID=1105144 RepID=A0ABU2CWL1_9MICO|nr:hypothetical protein [Promicromonospora iranensis]MDR7385678.1 hypothetical protein [Promicromonospora iranensis]